MPKKLLIVLTLVMIIAVGVTLAQPFSSGADTQKSESWFRWDAAALALIGVAVAVVFAGIGSAIGIGISANMALGAMHEHPKLFPQFLLLSALPGTQGIYGFVVGFLTILWTGLLNDPSKLASLTINDGWHFLFAGIPVGIAGLLSGIHQGKACASGVALVVKDKANVAKAMTLAAFIEFYAILGLLASVLVLLSIK